MTSDSRIAKEEGEHLPRHWRRGAPFGEVREDGVAVVHEPIAPENGIRSGIEKNRACVFAAPSPLARGGGYKLICDLRPGFV